MTKKDLIEQVSRKAHLTKRGATEAVDVFLNEIGRILAKGEKVVLSGFGTFKVTTMKSKTVRLPNKEEFVTVKSHRAPKFTAGKKLKKQVAR